MEAEEFQRPGSLPGFLCALALQEPAAFPLCTDLCTKNQKLVTAAMWKIQLICIPSRGRPRDREESEGHTESKSAQNSLCSAFTPPACNALLHEDQPAGTRGAVLASPCPAPHSLAGIGW